MLWCLFLCAKTSVTIVMTQPRRSVSREYHVCSTWPCAHNRISPIGRSFTIQTNKWSSVFHYKICGAVCFQFTHFPCDDWENIYTLSYYHHQIGSMNYYPLFRVRSWNNGVRCMSLYILINNLSSVWEETKRRQNSCIALSMLHGLPCIFCANQRGNYNCWLLSSYLTQRPGPQFTNMV